MEVNPEEVLRMASEVLALARSQGAASVALDLPSPQGEARGDSMLPKPNEQVLGVCKIIKTVAEVVPSVPEYCKSALDKIARDSQVAGVFRQEDVWLCVAVGSADQVEIHAVLGGQA